MNKVFGIGIAAMMLLVGLLSSLPVTSARSIEYFMDAPAAPTAMPGVAAVVSWEGVGTVVAVGVDRGNADGSRQGVYVAVVVVMSRGTMTIAPLVGSPKQETGAILITLEGYVGSYYSGLFQGETHICGSGIATVYTAA